MCDIVPRMALHTAPKCAVNDSDLAPLATLRRGLCVLEAIAAAPPTRGLDHGALARRLNFQRSTLYRYLACLRDAGFIEEVGSGRRYRLGPRILYLAAVMHGREYSDFARDYVWELAAITSETAHATVYDYPYSVTVQVTDGPGPVGPRVPIGSRRPLHCSASGKIFLAHERARVIDVYLAGALEQRTPNTIVDPLALRDQLADARRRGHAVDQAESYEDVCGLASPVHDFTGSVVGALSITVVTPVLSPARIAELARPLVHSASALSARLGHLPSGDANVRVV
jgi:IclR family transcriptional regulator, KDG regulon repressor